MDQRGDKMGNRLHSQWVTQVCGIRRQEKAPNPHLLRQSLMNLIGADADELVLAGARLARQHRLELFRLSGNQLVLRQAWGISVRDSPHAILGDLRCHVPMRRVDDKVGVGWPKEFAKIIIHLKSSLSQSATWSRGSYLSPST